MSEKEPVKFGTDGWRAVIADTYTFDNVRRVALATARNFKNHPKISNGIIIGYDTRFLSGDFAHTAAEVFANEGIKVFLTDTFVTTPAVSLISRNNNLAFGVMITASHNPYRYNGYKLKDEYGGSLSTDEINKVESYLSDIQEVETAKKFEELQNEGLIEYFNGRQFYIDYLKKSIDIEKIKASGLKAIFDCMYGTGQGLMKELLPEVEELHGELNPLFGGGAPEPVEKNLSAIKEKIKNGNYNIGLVTDGDSDRIAIIDEHGDFLDAQKTFAMLLNYLYEVKGMRGKVVRGFSTSELIEKYCSKHDIQLMTVPIGFKHISKVMIEEDILIGAEESGGIGIKGHLPERDGVYNGLLYMEMLAATGKSIAQLKKELSDEFGEYFYKRNDVHTTEELKLATLDKCKAMSPGDSIGGKIVTDINDLDGYKLSFENGWVLVRASGTEPLLRIYCETSGTDEVDEVLKKTIEQFNL